MSKLTNNTTQLELLLTKVNELPAAGGGEGGGIDTSDATATSSDILADKTAYVDGEKITGTIETKTASNLSASGATVTVPAGYYASQATKSVTSGSAKTPATTITKNPSISVNSSGLITASVSGTQNVTPTVSAGYVSSGTAGTITVSGSATKQLTTQAAKTVTPTTSSQTAVASGVYTTGVVTVAAIPSNYEDVAAETTEYTSLNAELEEVINSLPEAGGGSSGGIETCTLTLSTLGPIMDTGNIYFTNGEASVQMTRFETFDTKTVTVMTNSLVYGENMNPTLRGNIVLVSDNITGAKVYFISGDAKLEIL